MTFEARETSTHDGAPFECYWWSCGPQNWRQTSGDVERVLGGFTYTPEVLSHTEINQDQEIHAGGLKVELAPDNPVADLFRRYLPSRPVSLVIFQGHDGEAETEGIFIGTVGGVTKGEFLELHLVPEAEALKGQIPSLKYQGPCPRELFSPGCQVNRMAFQVTDSLTYVSGVTIKAPVFATKPDGWFTGGWVDFGLQSMAVQAHVGDTLILFYPMDGLQASSTVVVVPGCDGREATCRDKFANVVNHLGFARIPYRNPFGEGGVL